MNPYVQAKLQQKIDNLASHINLSTQDFSEKTQSHFQKIHYPKNSFLVADGEICDSVFIIIKGAVRSFIYDTQNNDITTWIGFENDVIFSPIHYTLQLPTCEIIQALEDTDVLAIKNATLRELYENDLDFNKLGRSLMENSMAKMTIRAHSFQCQFAEERYADLIQQKPDILQRVPLKHIATFIGVKVETLSRIRRNFKQKRNSKPSVPEVSKLNG